LARRGHITKQGSRLLRWAVVEATQKVPADAGWPAATTTPHTFTVASLSTLASRNRE
jgi:hypothetical protein